MRRTYRDGTRTLCPAQTVWPLAGLFFVPEPLRQKKALLRVLLSVQHSQGTRPRPPCLQGENARFSELSCRPCSNSFPQDKGRRSPCPAAQAALLPLLSAALCPGALQRGNTRHHSETGSGTGGQDGAYAASDKLPARGLCPCPDCLLGGERRRWVTLGQQVLQTVRLPDYWFDNQASAVHAQAHQSPRFQLQLCQKAGRNGQQHGITDLFQRARSIVVPMMISLCAFCPGVQDSVRELSRDRQGLGRQPCSPCCQPAP